MVLYRQIEWSTKLYGLMYGLGEKETMVLYIQIVIPGLMYETGEKRPCLFSPVSYMRP
jgi:hypothetical protein